MKTCERNNCTPVSKQYISFELSLSSQPPKSHAVVSTNVTVCARIVLVGRVPHTGARLQCMMALGAGCASLSWGSRGLERVGGFGRAREGLEVLRGVRVLTPAGGWAADDVDAARFTMGGADASCSLDALLILRPLGAFFGCFAIP